MWLDIFQSQSYKLRILSHYSNDYNAGAACRTHFPPNCWGFGSECGQGRGKEVCQVSGGLSLQ